MKILKIEKKNSVIQKVNRKTMKIRPSGRSSDYISPSFGYGCLLKCSYCYMKRWGKLNPVRFDEKELKTDLGKNNFIFVGSEDLMKQEWIYEAHEMLKELAGGEINGGNA